MSPPHTRGKELWGLQRTLWDGNTPAYAGKIHVAPGLERAKHPRIRGERGEWPAFNAYIGETPPHTRGKATTVFSAASA